MFRSPSNLSHAAVNMKRTGWPEISRAQLSIILSFPSFVPPTMTDGVMGQAEYVIFDMDGLLSELHVY
jgi:hypothetical protein